MFGFGGGNGSFRPGMGMQGGNIFLSRNGRDHLMTMPARNYGGAPSPGFGDEQIMPQPYGGPMPQPGGMPQQNYGQAAQGMDTHMLRHGQIGSGQFGGGMSSYLGGPAYGPSIGGQGMGKQFGGGMSSYGSYGNDRILFGDQNSASGSASYRPMLMSNYGGNMTMPAQYGGPMPQPGGMPQHNPGIEYGGMPSPDGGPQMNPGIPQRQFANGNPFYNARGNLRMRYHNNPGMLPGGNQGIGY